MEEEVPGLPVDPLVPVTKAHFRLNLVPKARNVQQIYCPPCLKLVWSSRSSFGSCDGSVTSKVWRHFNVRLFRLPSKTPSILLFSELLPFSMKARSGQNHDNKIAPQVSFNPTAANIMDILCIFVITKQYFFQRVCNYFNNKSFCFDYSNTFFIHAMNYFSVVLRIIFLMYIKNYFSVGPRIIFRGIANLFFWPTLRALN